jgi:hypothetical protein
MLSLPASPPPPTAAGPEPTVPTGECHPDGQGAMLYATVSGSVGLLTSELLPLVYQ